MRELERSVILKSDRQLAVSRKLVEYWKDEFKFNKNTYRVIPSTLRRAFSSIGLSGLEILERRKAFGIKRGDVVLVYSGSSAEWQSYDMMFDFVKGTLNRQRNVFIFFLADGNRYIRDLTEAFGERVRQFLVPPEKVPFYLEMCDFGLMIREKTTTNRVASPVKFAEYLASGLKVIVSDGIGDCSSMVKSLDLGFFYNETPGDLEPLTEEDRCRSRGAAISHFSKDAYSNFYLDLLNSRPE
jgi:glycosyltransferase involved in cell wall biosynthesis